jgi:hypothetical protein
LLEQFWHGVADVTAAAEDFTYSYSRMVARPRPLWAFLPNFAERDRTLSAFSGRLIHTVVCTFGAPASRRSVSLSSTAFDASPSVVVKSSGRLL